MSMSTPTHTLPSPPADAPLPAAVPFESASELQARHGDLLTRLDERLGEDTTDDRPALAEMGPAMLDFLARGTATGVVLDEQRERTAAQVLLDYWAHALERCGLPRPATRLARFDAEQLPVLPEDACPYVGLESFRAGAHFHGREADTQALLAQVAAQAMVVVVGASGSGKSSLVMGGVRPALQAQTGADGQPAWRMATPWVPGDAALLHLAQAAASVVPGLDAPALAQALRGDPAALAQALAGQPPVVLVLDQAEELFTLTEDAERQTLATALAGLLAAGQGHRLLLTLREDFRSRMVQLTALRPWLDSAWYSMRPMGYDELRAAVERPAAAVNLVVQPAVVDDLVKRVLGQPAALPLLQFTLRQLWAQRDRNRITQAVYQQVGDPLDALEGYANRVHDSQLPQTRDEMRRVLLALVRVDDLLEAYRQPVRLQTLLAAGSSTTDQALRVLVDSDLVRISHDHSAPGTGDSVVEVKHEALIRNWPRLVGWIDEKRLARRQRLALSQAAQRWDDAGRPAEGLLTGWQLQEARNREAELGERERAFVAASEAALVAEQERRAQAEKRELEIVIQQLQQDKEQQRLAAEAQRLNSAQQEQALQQERITHAMERRKRRLTLVALLLVMPLIAFLIWQNLQANAREQAAKQREDSAMAQLNEARQQAEATAREILDNAADLDLQRQALDNQLGALLALRLDQALRRQGLASASAPRVQWQVADSRQTSAANNAAAQLRGQGWNAGPATLAPPAQALQRTVRANQPGAQRHAELLARALADTYGGYWQVLVQAPQPNAPAQLQVDVPAEALSGSAPDAAPTRGWTPPAAPPTTPSATTTGAAPAKPTAEAAATPQARPLGQAQAQAQAKAAARSSTQDAEQAAKLAAIERALMAAPPGAGPGTQPAPAPQATTTPNTPPAAPLAAAAPSAAPVTPPAPVAVARPTTTPAPATPATAAFGAPEDRIRLLIFRLDNGRTAQTMDEARGQHAVSWSASRDRAAKMNLTSPLARAVLYDTGAAHGALQAAMMRSRKDPAAPGPEGEAAWLLDYLNRREGLADTALRPTLEKARLAELRRLIAAGDWQLAHEAPLRR